MRILRFLNFLTDCRKIPIDEKLRKNDGPSLQDLQRSKNHQHISAHEWKNNRTSYIGGTEATYDAGNDGRWIFWKIRFHNNVAGYQKLSIVTYRWLITTVRSKITVIIYGPKSLHHLRTWHLICSTATYWSVYWKTSARIFRSEKNQNFGILDVPETATETVSFTMKDEQTHWANPKCTY